MSIRTERTLESSRNMHQWLVGGTPSSSPLFFSFLYAVRWIRTTGLGRSPMRSLSESQLLSIVECRKRNRSGWWALQEGFRFAACNAKWPKVWEKGVGTRSKTETETLVLLIEVL